MACNLVVANIAENR